jgi:hypothetical protein
LAKGKTCTVLCRECTTISAHRGVEMCFLFNNLIVIFNLVFYFYFLFTFFHSFFLFFHWLSFPHSCSFNYSPPPFPSLNLPSPLLHPFPLTFFLSSNHFFPSSSFSFFSLLPYFFPNFKCLFSFCLLYSPFLTSSFHHLSLFLSFIISHSFLFYSSFYLSFVL